MKKALSVLLSILMIFSCCTLIAFADGEAPTEVYTVKFVDWDGTELKSVEAVRGDIVAAPANPERASEDKNLEYVFKGWSADGGTTCYHAGTIPIATQDVTYTAIYAEVKKEETQTFWNLVQSIFARINKIFEYFFAIFSKDNPFI